MLEASFSSIAIVRPEEEQLVLPELIKLLVLSTYDGLTYLLPIPRGLADGMAV